MGAAFGLVNLFSLVVMGAAFGLIKFGIFSSYGGLHLGWLICYLWLLWGLHLD